MRVITEERSQDNLEIPRVSSRAREYDAKCNRAKRSTGAKTYNSIDIDTLQHVAVTEYFMTVLSSTLISNAH